MSRPSKIVCVGLNYADHIAELGSETPDRPLLFLKPPSAVIGNGETIELPRASQRVDYEGEIGVVVGRPLRRADEAAALDAVAGITCVNDVTARDLQHTDGQWTRAKGFDTFCPIGPAVVPLSDLPPLDELEVICRVNGARKQHGAAKAMVFKIPVLLSYISEIMTLEPGDVVATGTPVGVGPLADGDRVEIEIPRVGILANLVRAEP